jgi:hypothetical protein
MKARSFILAAALVSLGCARQAEDPRPIAGSWFAEIEVVGPHGHGGFATVSLVPDTGTRANVTLTGGSAGGDHPWHVHQGRCGSDGAIIGDPSKYPHLRPDESGNASATTLLEPRLDPDGTYYVAIHQSGEDDSEVGCGDLISNR